jgi:hypothetical protein
LSIGSRLSLPGAHESESGGLASGKGGAFVISRRERRAGERLGYFFVVVALPVERSRRRGGT